MNDLNDLPEYSLSLPTWHGDGKGGFIGCKRWKRRTHDGWMIGEADIEGGEIKVTWSHAYPTTDSTSHPKGDPSLRSVPRRDSDLWCEWDFSPTFAGDPKTPYWMCKHCRSLTWGGYENPPFSAQWCVARIRALMKDLSTALARLEAAIEAISSEGDPDAPGRPWLIEHVLDILTGKATVAQEDQG